MRLNTFRNFVLCLLLMLSAAGELCAQGLDSLKKVELTAKLEEYFEALKYESIEVQKAECDFLIDAADTQEVRDFIAQTIYDHYIDSKIMGAEAVAIHLTDNWFTPAKVSFADGSELFAAKVFAEFNRLSQVGLKAPELLMETLEGERMNPLETEGFKVLYFYDTDCANCRLETIMLTNVLETEDFPVTLYAIYVGDDRDEWKEYISDRLTLEEGRAEVVHLWDPALDSDYQRKYGILQTPRMFLLAPDGTILGRGLDSQALSQMLHGIFDEVQLEYGSDESAKLFEGIFPEAALTDFDDVKGLVDYIASGTLPKGDITMFRQLTGDLLYYLAINPCEGFKEGMDYLIKNNIKGKPEVWTSHDDSLKVVGFAQIMEDLLAKSRPGSRIKDVKVLGELMTWKKEKPVKISLSKIKGENNIILFYTEGCSNCKAEKEAAAELMKLAAEDKELRGVKVLMVNVDKIMRDDPTLAGKLFDSFDLSTLPFMIMTDRKGIITRRYTTLL